MIPLAKPMLGEREEQLVLETMRSRRLALGPRLPEFERALSARLGSPASAVSSGTAGLHLAVRASGVQPGDEVITTPFSFVSSSNCVVYEGATPVFCDIDPRTLNLDPEAAEAAVGERTSGILPVHIFGYPADMPAIERIATRHNLWIVEGLDLPCPDADGDARGWFVYVVQLPRGVDRDATIEALRARGVDSKPYLPAIHLMSFYRDRFGHRVDEFPVAEDVARRSLALPFYPGLGEGEVAQVAEALEAVLDGQLSGLTSATN